MLLYAFAFVLMLVQLAPAQTIGNGTNNPIEPRASVYGYPPGHSTTCGGILQNASSGFISYKYFDRTTPNETCIWIVRAPGATRYTGNLDANYNGFASSLIVSGFGFSGVNHAIKGHGGNFNVSGNVLVITFTASNPDHDRGFLLTFAGIADTNEVAANTSEDHLIRADTGHIKYPSSRDTYGNNELSIFIFEPTYNRQNQLRKTQVLYVRDGLERNTCYDHLVVWTFNRSTNDQLKWTNGNSDICGDIASSTITNEDIILIYFQSDNSVVSSGFHLYSQAI